ncbi:acyltransferase family protein [Vibrio sp. EA2]|uniref:acyltransferase family protein n=1 Tax=Vibrio sp. EA2 TaxID=3079860 RepID=UPI002949722F|nr:acyltransferase family protein [Vibrio sp. EA2]MDV6253315.1 acyltransferase family protein [Vibrio sp. EA2]
MQFRKDINALRALAVILVVVYHFNSTWVPGGFVGVDVFFVISGFLMTKIILQREEVNLSSLINFYIARLNRIVPALAFLCIALLALGWFYFAGEEYETLAKHARYSLTFLSNQVYLGEAGYFAAASREKWLLHTWSLSIEWQFYLLYPIFIGIVLKLFSRARLSIAINTLLLISLFYCGYVSSSGDTSGYFMLSARAWEMLLGSWAVLYKPRRPYPAYVGWLLVLSTALVINKDYVWPSLVTLLPTLGALIILWANQNNRVNDSYVVQKIGLYSYSIYLWHWPVVVLFYKLNLNTPLWLFAGIALSLLLGGLSYHTVEQVRFTKNIHSAKRLLLQCKPLWIILILVGTTKFIAEENGFPTRGTLEPELVELYGKLSKKTQMSPFRSKCHIVKYTGQQPKDACTFSSGVPEWAIIGDSHASELAFSLSEPLKKESKNLIQLTMSGCPPSYMQSEEFSDCVNWTNDVVSFVSSSDEIKNVVIAYRYSAHLFGGNEHSYPDLPNDYSDERKEQVLQSLKLTVNTLLEQGKEVYLMMPVPEMGISIKTLVDQAYMQKKDLTNIPSVDVSYYEKRNQLFYSFMSKSTFKPGLHPVEIRDFFCDESQCYAVRDKVPLYFDDDHPGLSITNDIAARILNSKS